MEFINRICVKAVIKTENNFLKTNLEAILQDFVIYLEREKNITCNTASINLMHVDHEEEITTHIKADTSVSVAPHVSDAQKQPEVKPQCISDFDTIPQVIDALSRIKEIGEWLNNARLITEEIPKIRIEIKDLTENLLRVLQNGQNGNNTNSK